MITRTVISRLTGLPTSEIEQVGAKQLFITPDAVYSYKTKIARYDTLTKCWIILIGADRISCTTTRHVNIIKRMFAGAVI